MMERTLISIIIPAFNEAASLPLIIKKIHDMFQGLDASAEILIIDDGSSDNTFELITDLAIQYPQLHCIQFSRNFGKEIAITAGLKYATGNAAIIMDADGQHPPEFIKIFIDLWKQGYQVVYGIQRDQIESKTYRTVKRWYYSVLAKITSINMPPNAGDFRLLDRKAIDSLNTLPERTRYMKGLYAWVGYQSVGIEFSVQPRLQGNSKFGLIKLFKLALMGITGFTVLPLRLVSFAGLLLSFSSLLYGSWLVFEHLFYKDQLPGWATLSVGMMFLEGIQLLALGIIGEYIGNIFEEVKQRPLYVVNKNTLPSTQLKSSQHESSQHD